MVSVRRRSRRFALGCECEEAPVTSEALFSEQSLPRDCSVLNSRAGAVDMRKTTAIRSVALENANILGR